MSAAFERAWAVLKDDNVLGEGSYRVVTRGEDPNLAYKTPSEHADGPTMNPLPVATGQALAQMGYPFAPETPIVDPKSGRTMTTQALALDDLQSMFVGLSGGLYPPPYGQNFGDYPKAYTDQRDRFFERMGWFEWPQGRDGYDVDPFLNALGLWDIRNANVGVYEDGPKVIDFGTKLPAYEPIDSGRSWSIDAARWGDVPDEKRRTFINLFGDKSLFDPWREGMNREDWRESGAYDWGAYLQALRNLQFFNDLKENPEQRRLFEFDADADPNDWIQIEDLRRAMAMNKKRKERFERELEQRGQPE